MTQGDLAKKRDLDKRAGLCCGTDWKEGPGPRPNSMGIGSAKIKSIKPEIKNEMYLADNGFSYSINSELFKAGMEYAKKKNGITT